ncbi:MAG TPA: endonuclease [Flavobacterium sp.]|nr:endonuclease [Flavobacterium sp.]
MIKYIALFFLLTFHSLMNAQVVINELDTDTPSTDDREFIELKSDTPKFSLDGYVLVLFNGTGSQKNLSYYVVDLDDYITDENGIFVIGNSLVSPVPDKLLPDNIFQNGPDGVGLYIGSSSDFPNLSLATQTNLIDALVYDTSDADAIELMALFGVNSQIDENQNNLKTTQSIQRKNDGTYETKTPTPGKNNDGIGFVYNGVQINVNVLQYNEGEAFTITFTTETPVVDDMAFTFSVNSGSFKNSDYTGNLSIVIPKGLKTASSTITLIDDIENEGDEVAKIKFGTLPFGYKRLNDNIEIRIVDNDFIVSNWGTPLNPTFGKVINTMPDGYYNTLEGKSGEVLKQAIQDIIANPNVVRAHNYGDIETILKIADQNPLNSNEVWLMYVENSKSKLDFQETGINTGKWNREHIYPQSRGGFTDGTSEIPDGINVWLPTNANDILAGHADAHHIRAEDGAENSIRSNKDYGEYIGPTGTKGSWHGDVARSVFYMAIRYNALNVVNGNPDNTTIGQLGDLALLLQWNKSDPSDDFEMNRNNYIYTWQVNRNPFIDYPNLADYVWGENAGQVWYSTLSNNSVSNKSIAIYPNPITDYMMFSGITDSTLVEIYSVSGSKIYQTTITTDSKIKLNLASGIYLAKLSSENNTTLKKIIVR